MTMLAVTITKTGAVISQDSAIYETSPEYKARVGGVRVTRDLNHSFETCYQGGSDPKSAVIVGYGMKMMPMPRFNMAIAGTGSFRLITGWFFGIIGVKTLDIVDLNDVTPDALRQLAKGLEVDDGAVVVHAGYSPRLGRGVGFAYASGNDFESEELSLGETMAAAPDLADPEYGAMCELAAHANRGERITEYHAALMRQQHRSAAAGKMGAGFAIGGDLNHCIIGPDNIMIRTAAE